MPRHRKKYIDLASAIVLLALMMLDIAAWKEIARSAAGERVPSIDFLPVAQGEAVLLTLSDGVTVLTDAGPDGAIVDDLQKALPPGNGTYIDLAIISYPQNADYEGYRYLLQHYRVGAFLYNGRADTAYGSEWKQLLAAIAAKHIPLITVGAGDHIHYDAAGSKTEIDILSPDPAFARSADPVDTGIVQRVITRRFVALLTADIGGNVEGSLLSHADGADMRSTILKASVAGLGSPAGNAFLRAVAPRTIVIEPGVKRSASVPTKAMLAGLASSTDAAVVTAGHGRFLLYNE